MCGTACSGGFGEGWPLPSPQHSSREVPNNLLFSQGDGDGGGDGEEEEEAVADCSTCLLVGCGGVTLDKVEGEKEGEEAGNAETDL